MATPEGWTVTSLGAVCDLRMGGTPARKEAAYWDTEKKTENRWVAISDIRRRFLYDTAEYISDQGVEKSPVKRIEPGIPLMSFKLTIGRATIPRVPVYTNEAIVALVPRKPIVREYLFYAVPPIASAAVATDAVKGKTLNKEMMQQLLILLPPLPEQRKIAAILSAVDEVIEKTEAVIESLQALKKAMMQELLTRGLPGRHTRFKQTEIGEVPEGWEVRGIKDVVESCDYGLSEKMSTNSMLTPILRMGNIQDGEVILDDLKYVDDALPSAAGLYLAPGDVLFNRTNSKDLVGKVGLFLGTDGPVTFASYLLRMKAKPGVAVGPWLAAILNTERNQAALRALATPGVSQANINRTKLLGFLVPTPPIDEQDEIVDVLDSAARRLLLEKAELASANAVKSALMSVLLTGELRVTPDQGAA